MVKNASGNRSTGGPGPVTTAMIIGIDVASENCYIAAAKGGGIEIILNEYSQRSTPGYVAFGEKQREIGVSAKQKQMMNLSNTIYDLVRLIGRPYQQVIETEKTSMGDPLPFQLEPSPSGEVMVRVWHQNEERTFTATQVLAMLFTKLRQVAEDSIDCVINCPTYFTDCQRRALLDAARIAGLNPLKVCPDMTAVGIYYAFYRQPRAVAEAGANEISVVGFLDCGQSHTQCAVILFNNKDSYMKVLSLEYDPNLGGKHFDEVIAAYFINQYHMTLSKRAKFRLLAECEKLKKSMSANSSELPINVECLQDDKDFHAKMDRALFENLAVNLFERIEQLLRRALDFAVDAYQKHVEDQTTKGKTTANLPKEFALHSFEIVGGSSRIPAIKRLVKQVMGVEPSTTLNADEAVARGCALQCAMLSPTFRTAKELQVIDFAPYQINCRYWSEPQTPDTKIHVLPKLYDRGHSVPFTRQLTVSCTTLPMIFEFEYVTESGSTEVIGQFKVSAPKDFKLDAGGSRFKVRVRMDPNGTITITEATINIEVEVEVEVPVEPVKSENGNKQSEGGNQPMEVDGQQVNQNDQQDQTKQQEQSNADINMSEAPQQPKTERRIQKQTRAIALTIERLWIKGQLSETELDNQREIELGLVLADKSWKEKLDARNELEEFVYEWRDKMECGDYDQYINAADKETFLGLLRETENWLYEEEETGEVRNKSVYQEKLGKLRSQYSDGIQFRRKEKEERGAALEQLGRNIQLGRKILEAPDSRELISAETLQKLEEELQGKAAWLDTAHATLNTAPSNQNPPITCADIRAQADQLQEAIRPVLTEKQKKMDEIKKQQEEAAKAKEQAKSPNSKDQKKTAGDDHKKHKGQDGSQDGVNDPQGKPMEVDGEQASANSHQEAPDVAPTI